MKKFMLAMAIMCSAFCTAGYAADETWAEEGLSEGECKWVSVQFRFITDETGNAKEVWHHCQNNEINCVNKFCSSPKQQFNDKDKSYGWDKEDCNKYCVTFQEDLPIEGHKVRSISGDSGVELLSSYFGMWYKFGALVLGLIAVLIIVISGVQISMGGASEEAVSSAKTRIMAAILSLILLFSSALILKTINPLFFT